jgi:ribosome recycling factor
MATNQIKTKTDDHMKKSLEALKHALGNVRTGKAHTSMLDPIKVNYYGNMTPLSQVAALSCPDPKTFMIAPWEVNMLKEIEAAIVKSNVGMTPINDGKKIILKLPELTEQRRKEMVKQIGKLIEDAKVAIRMARRDANEEIKVAQKNKAVSEDESKKSQDDIQKMTDDFISKVDQLAQDKEKELMTV